jgi:hypothetical protein
VTLLEKALSKRARAIIDSFRQKRGIRTRKQALEILIQENIPLPNSVSDTSLTPSLQK